MIESKTLRKTLQNFGFSDPAISAAWPEWWGEGAENSISAQNELRFSLSRKLGLDPRSLLDADEPQFIWNDEAKYKHFSGDPNFEGAALTSFGMSLARSLIRAVEDKEIPRNLNSNYIRESILKSAPYVSLKELINLSWGLGIPVIHLKIFPLTAKHMCAMTLRVDDRYVVMLGREAPYPAQIAYYLAHELGHIILGHLKDSVAVVEFDDILKTSSSDLDEEEISADRFALEILTGRTDPNIFTDMDNFSAKELAGKAISIANELKIEPGTIALCLGHSSGRWDKIMIALRIIYNINDPIWETINRVANSQIDFSLLSDEFSSYLNNVMGSIRK